LRIWDIEVHQVALFRSRSPRLAVIQPLLPFLSFRVIGEVVDAL